MAAKNEYRVIKTVTPASARRDLGRKRCFFTVSVGAHRLPVKKIEIGFSWMLGAFEECALVVGDTLCRITTDAPPLANACEVLRHATSVGDRFLESFHPMMDRYADRGIKVIRFSTLLQMDAFHENLASLDDLCRIDPRFAHSVRADAAAFIARQKRAGRLVVDYATAMNTAERYLMEEFALYCVLADLGWLVEAYPGKELPTLANICNGLYPLAPEPLRRRINISLTFKRLHRSKE